MLFGQFEQGMVIGEVVGPKVRCSFEFVFIGNARQKLVKDELVVSLQHLCAQCGFQSSVQQVPHHFSLQPVHDGVVMEFTKAHHVGGGHSVHDLSPRLRLSFCIEEGIGKGRILDGSALRPVLGQRIEGGGEQGPRHDPTGEVLHQANHCAFTFASHQDGMAQVLGHCWRLQCPC